MRKARQAVGAALEEIAPQQSAHLWKTLVSFKSLEAQDSSSDTEDGDVDQVLMVALETRNLINPTFELSSYLLILRKLFDLGACGKDFHRPRPLQTICPQ